MVVVRTLRRLEACPPHGLLDEKMNTTPLYRMRFTYPESWSVSLAGAESTESQQFFIAEGTCEGKIAGRLRASNHPRRRGDGTFEPNFQGVIETADGAVIYHDCRGYGRAYPPGRRQIVVCAFHLSDDARYKWLNNVLAVGTGEVRAGAEGSVLVIDWYEVVWEAVAE